MIRAEKPGFEFSAFSINQNLEIGMHRDTTNLKGTWSTVIGLNKFQADSCGLRIRREISRRVSPYYRAWETCFDVRESCNV